MYTDWYAQRTRTSQTVNYNIIRFCIKYYCTSIYGLYFVVPIPKPFRECVQSVCCFCFVFRATRAVRNLFENKLNDRTI